MYSNDTARIPPTLPVISDHIPSELRPLRRWVLWKWELRQDHKGQSQWAKVPYQANGHRARSNDPSTWAIFDHILPSLPHFDGLGFMLGDGIGGIDLDKCRDAATGILHADARAVVQEMNTYTEISPRSCGVKLLLYGSKPAGRCRVGNTEIYGEARFFTITGHHLDGTPTTVERRQEELSRLHARLFPINDNAAKVNGSLLPTDDDLPDAEILDLAGKARNGDKFRKLWAGDWQSVSYPSQSEADQALVGILAFWTGPNAERIDRLFRRSGLYRDKWERHDYRDRTIQRVLEHQQDYYRWDDPDLHDLEDQLEHIIQPVEIGGPQPSRLIRWSQLKGIVKERSESWVVEKILPTGGITILSGLPYSGKTTLVDYLIGCVVQGLPFLGFAARTVPILFYDFDRSEKQRIGRLCRYVKDESLLERHFFTVNWDVVSQPLTPTELLKDVSQPSLVIIDPFRTAFLTNSEAGAENDSALMSGILAPLKKVAHKTNSAVLVLHHNNRARDDYAGTAAIAGNTLAMWNYSRDEESASGILKIKTRDEVHKPISVQLTEDGMVKVGKDDELVAFVSQFPESESAALTLEGVMDLPWVQVKGIKERQARKYLDKAQQAGIFPRLEQAGRGTKNEPHRWYRV